MTSHKMTLNKYSTIRSGLLVAFLASVPAFAANSGNITIGGTVAPVDKITVTSETGYDALDFATTAADLKIATVVEENNDPDGYTVTLVSTNAADAGSDQARLKGADTENADVVNYSIKYGAGGSEAAVMLGATGEAVVSTTSTASVEGGDSKNLLISYPGNPWLRADTYSDTLTLIIAAK